MKRTKKFSVTLNIGYESYNGYDHYINSTYEVEAINSASAINKAKKLVSRGYWVSSQSPIVRQISPAPVLPKAKVMKKSMKYFTIQISYSEIGKKKKPVRRKKLLVFRASSMSKALRKASKFCLEVGL